MKIATFYDLQEKGKYRVGAFSDAGKIAELTFLFNKKNLTASEAASCFDLDGDFFGKAQTLDLNSLEQFARSEITLAAPVPRPGKIICVGLNYRNHAIESGMEIPRSPIIFSKFSSCAIGAGEPIRIPSGSEKTDFEAELAVVIGRRAKSVSRDEAMDCVFGYANFNDVSARDFQFADGQWQRGKSCDSFAPFGEFVASKDEIPNPHNLRVRFRLNGETLQDSNSEELIFKIPELIEFLSKNITLEVGDVIATGTPPGVGFARTPPVFMKDGDVAEVEIEGLGVLRNPVKS